MKLNKKLKSHIWLYLIIFTLIIILFLWLFQVIFINKYYELSKIDQIKNTTLKIIRNYSDASEYLDKISYEDNICIEIVKNKMTVYSSNESNRGCLTSNYKYKKDTRNWKGICCYNKSNICRRYRKNRYNRRICRDNKK